MKATLEFNLPDEQAEFDMALEGGQYRYCLEEICAKLRSEFKHKDVPITLEEFRDWLFAETQIGDLLE